MILSRVPRFVFPLVMISIMAATVVQYRYVRDFRAKTVEYNFVVEADDMESIMKALQDAEYRPVLAENISGDRYRLIVRCPSDSVGVVAGIIQRLGCNRE